MALPKLLRIVPRALVPVDCGSDQAAGPPAVAQAGAGGQPRYDAVQTVAVSPSEHDRFLSTSFDSANCLYTAGFVADGADQHTAVTRFNAVVGEDDRGRNLVALSRSTGLL